MVPNRESEHKENKLTQSLFEHMLATVTACGRQVLVNLQHSYAGLEILP